MIRTYVGIGFAFFSLAHFKYFIIISKTVVGCTVRTSTHFTHSRSRGRAGWFTILILVTFRLYKKTKVTKADTRPVERDFSACGNNLLVPSRSRINTLRVVMVWCSSRITASTSPIRGPSLWSLRRIFGQVSRRGSPGRTLTWWRLKPPWTYWGILRHRLITEAMGMEEGSRSLGGEGGLPFLLQLHCTLVLACYYSTTWMMALDTVVCSMSNRW